MRSLRFEEKPDYAYLRQLIRKKIFKNLKRFYEYLKFLRKNVRKYYEGTVAAGCPKNVRKYYERTVAAGCPKKQILVSGSREK